MINQKISQHLGWFRSEESGVRKGQLSNLRLHRCYFL
jgi:hypothetical protein